VHTTPSAFEGEIVDKMNAINQLSGKMIYAIAKILSFMMDGAIQLIETSVLLVRSMFKMLAVLISMGGCLFFFLIGSIGIRILANPAAMLTLIIMIVFPVIGIRLVAYLTYLKYVTTEYLFNLANHLIDAKKYSYQSVNVYKKAYRKAEEERIREEQRRYYEQQREWNERFSQWHQYSSQRSQGGFYGGQGSFSGNYGSQDTHGRNFANPMVEFKNKYKKSCEVLGVSEDADKYKIKLAYRRKAKEHHPDVNNNPNATKKFQEINDAYEFLNEDNIRRYATM
jgi:DnaJ-domain-containing protein 1